MKLNQKIGILKGTLEIEVGSDDIIYITHANIFNKSTFKYSLDDIDPNFVTYNGFSFSASVISIASFVIGLSMLLFGMNFKQAPDDFIYYFTFFILIFPAVGYGVKALKSKVNLVTFNFRNGTRSFSLLGNKPNSEQVESFCKSLSARIGKIRYNGDISKDRLNEILKKHIEFIFENGLLNESEMENLKQKVDQKTKPNVVSFGGPKNL